MWSKFIKAIEWIGHAQTMGGILGWIGLPSLGAGAVGWALTFFSSAAEGWSVTGVWLASLAAGLMCAAILAAIAIGIAYVRGSINLTPTKWLLLDAAHMQSGLSNNKSTATLNALNTINKAMQRVKSKNRATTKQGRLSWP